MHAELITGSDSPRERGMALIAALLIMLLMSALLVGFTSVVMSDQRFRGIDKDRFRAFYGAQSGLEKLTVDIGNLFLTNVAPTDAQVIALGGAPPTVPFVTFTAPAGVTAYGARPVACNNAGQMSCNATVQTGPYQGLITLKKAYQLDVVAKTTAGSEAHLIRKIETVAIPVFQFGIFSNVDLSFFAGNPFNFGGRVHTNGNLFLTAQDSYTTTLTDKVTAVGDVIRQNMQNGKAIGDAGFNGTVSMAKGTNSFRNMLATEGSLSGGVGSAVNTNWPTVSLTTYNGYIRNGGCPPGVGCSVPSRGTGAKSLNLVVVTVGGANTDLARRPPVGEDTTNNVLYGERMFTKASVRILLSDTATDITSLPSVTATPPVRLGDEGGPGAGLTNDWAVTAPNNGTAYGPVDATHPPIARSPGLQTVTTTAATAAGANAISVNVGALVPGSYYRTAATTQFDVYNGAVLSQTIGCTIVTATQFQNCKRVPDIGLLAVAVGYTIRVKDGSATGQGFAVTGAVGAAGAGTTKNYTVASTAAAFNNSFWMKSTANQSWDVVTCTGANSNGVSGGAVVQWQNCSGSPDGVPQTAAGATTITNGAAAAQNVGTIGGYLKIEIQRADLSWQDVTMEILNWGFAAPNQVGAICADPTPNAIIRIQRLRDNGAGALGCTYANSQSSYDYWPNTIFDTREALLRETAPADQYSVLVSGVMHYISLDAGNLAKWLAGAAPYGAGTGNQALSVNGYTVYFSDRRNNRDDNNLETGEYGFEDLVNPGDANGTPNGALDAGEDMNGNGTLEVYGQYPNFLAVKNSMPPGALAPLGPAAANVRPMTAVGRAYAMTNRALLFRRALKLVNGTRANLAAIPGLTVVTENPVYIQGDWNWDGTSALTDPHAETSVIADAVTLLSSNWTDSNSFANPYDAYQRVRSANWYRIAII